ncbi:MAG: radical SAM protein [Eubacterium sp.]|nr:radical SAM protein [Eubacterium sp.]
MHYSDYKTILSPKNGINLYRGCTHGCIYCDSRSNCYQINHIFEDIEVKRGAPVIFEKELRKKRKPCMIGTGSMCDPYIHLESELKITRKCLELVEKYGFGISILTKSDRIMRDIDILYAINAKSKSIVQMTLTTFDEELCRKIEPNVSTTLERVKVLETMREAEIPTVVWLGPVLPLINDNEENLKGILEYCVKSKVRGILCFGFGLTLREGNREYFYSSLDRLFPEMKQKYIKKFGNKYNCLSDNNDRLTSIFIDTCRRHNIFYKLKDIFGFLKDFPEKEQMSIFDF